MNIVEEILTQCDTIIGLKKHEVQRPIFHGSLILFYILKLILEQMSYWEYVPCDALFNVCGSVAYTFIDR